jgi:hypothetical protein
MEVLIKNQNQNHKEIYKMMKPIILNWIKSDKRMFSKFS